MDPRPPYPSAPLTQQQPYNSLQNALSGHVSKRSYAAEEWNTLIQTIECNENALNLLEDIVYNKSLSRTQEVHLSEAQREEALKALIRRFGKAAYDILAPLTENNAFQLSDNLRRMILKNQQQTIKAERKHLKEKYEQGNAALAAIYAKQPWWQRTKRALKPRCVRGQH